MKKILSLKRKYFICAAALLLVSGAAFFFLKTCLPSSENKEFESYIEDIFQQEMKTNTLNLHYTLAYPEDYGIDEYQVTLGTMEPDALEKNQKEAEKLQRELEKFDLSQLSEENQIIYDILSLEFSSQLSKIFIIIRSPWDLPSVPRPSFPYFWQNIPSALLQISRIIFLFWQIFRNTSRVSWNLKKRRLKKGCL